MPNRTLRIATFNIHKGVSSFNARLVLRQQRELIRRMQADIVFLQEVRGEHWRHEHLHAGPQHEYLADSCYAAYGKNAVYPSGHHGNAVLSRYPITCWNNIDISANPVEQRGLLHCEIAIPNWSEPLHGICVHLGLLGRWRRRQLQQLQQHIDALVPPHAPLVIAGDFNDWHGKAGHWLADLRMKEVFEHTEGQVARSFPALFPVLRLDRIYTRGFRIHSSQVHAGVQSAIVSDHAALSTTLSRT